MTYIYALIYIVGMLIIHVANVAGLGMFIVVVRHALTSERYNTHAERVIKLSTHVPVGT